MSQVGTNVGYSLERIPPDAEEEAFQAWKRRMDIAQQVGSVDGPIIFNDNWRADARGGTPCKSSAIPRHYPGLATPFTTRMNGVRRAYVFRILEHYYPRQHGAR